MYLKLRNKFFAVIAGLILVTVISGCSPTQTSQPGIKLIATQINSDSIELKWKTINPFYRNVYYRISKTDVKSNKTELLKGAAFKIYLKTDWQKPYIHFGGLYGWTNAPGVEMEKVNAGTYSGCYEYTIHDASFVEVTFNDDGKVWDNNKGKNYTLVESGIYYKDEKRSGNLERVGDLTSQGFNRNDYIDRQVKSETEYLYKILAVNSSGQVVAESNPLKIKTLPKEISLYPYLTWNNSNSSTSEVVINFQTKESETVTVKYGTEKENLNKTEVSKKTKIHHVELKELKPNTEYWYKICTNELKDKIYHFNTAKKNTDKYSFIILNDMQDGVDYNTPPRRWSDIANAVKNIMDKEKISFIIAPGDLISNDSNINWKIFFDKGREVLPYIVIMPVPGNHETAGDSAHGRNGSNYNGEKHFKEYFDLPGAENYYSFNFDDSLFIGLDTEELSDIETFKDSKQYDWTANILNKNSRGKEWVFVYQHIPAYSVSERHKDQCIAVRPITELFDGKVDWDFAAHMHNYQRFNPLKYNTTEPGSPIVEKTYGTGKNQGVGYITLAPSGNNPEKMANDTKGLLAFPSPEDIKNGTFSEIGFTKVDVDENKITITTYGLGNLINKKKLHVYDKVSYAK